jgi:hypothetical protein
VRHILFCIKSVFVVCSVLPLKDRQDSNSGRLVQIAGKRFGAPTAEPVVQRLSGCAIS